MSEVLETHLPWWNQQRAASRTDTLTEETALTRKHATDGMDYFCRGQYRTIKLKSSVPPHRSRVGGLKEVRAEGWSRIVRAPPPPGGEGLYGAPTTWRPRRSGPSYRRPDTGQRCCQQGSLYGP